MWVSANRDSRMGMMDTIGRVYTMSKTKKAQELLSTIESNNVEKVKELLEEGADANATVGKMLEACALRAHRYRPVP